MLASERQPLSVASRVRCVRLGRIAPTVITLCGELTLEVAGTRIEDLLPSRQGRILFAYLVLHRGRAVTRSELIEALWPGRPPADPGGSLSALVSKLRRALGADVLAGRQKLRLQLGPSVWIDVEAAEETMNRAQAALAGGKSQTALASAESVLALLEEELLPGVDLAWVDERRHEFEELKLAALECAAAGALATENQNLAVAERAARSLIAGAPFRESGYRFLMEAHERKGNIAEGLIVFELLRSLLRNELGAMPGHASHRVHERLLAQGDEAAHSFPGHRPG